MSPILLKRPILHARASDYRQSVHVVLLGRFVSTLLVLILTMEIFFSFNQELHLLRQVTALQIIDKGYNLGVFVATVMTVEVWIKLLACNRIP